MTPSTKTPATKTPSERPTPFLRSRGPATVVPFPKAPARRLRREDDDAPRGQILLFTGVRYERLPDADAPAVPQRRRS
ncbi:hypothetical protein ASG52_20470 [Methylobacterium sp. Leaf456]|uniref:hypothetical protein n=1 Tax=Methylobacterium sp. Leaf456 TaxID=1736382 RepID=UPI00070209A6|nr:hypothetical protein [Methylobacterium sp. Leaf456]KQT59758.1 hypothetical protein ASG52_20470 [Methylobacterium sp. Leaf456]